MENDLALLNEKIDHMNQQMATLTAYVASQQRRQREMEELKQDIIPIGNHMVKLAIDELAEIDTEFELEDLLFLLKRVLRNTNLILELMDRVESFAGLANETEILGKQVFASTVETLDRLEREGYFDLAREGGRALENIVTEMNNEDIRSLGDNLPSLLKTLQKLSQPEVLTLVDGSLEALQSQETEETISTLKLLGELRHPEVRAGLARLLNIIKVFAH
ncbi:MAG: hypothetical protein MAG431_00622 [Chloroflexi bacterium]|nr:hypothetical protein [Chloroflexota bacterium]